MSTTTKRTKLRSVPAEPRTCLMACVYADNGICRTPRTNKGNSDAACHRMSNTELCERLVAFNPHHYAQG